MESPSDTSTTQPRPEDLTRFAGALRDLASRQTVDEALQHAVDLACEAIPGCDLADVMFIRPGGMITPVATDPIAVALDEAQDSPDGGPCVTAARDEQIVVSGDLAEDPRWPSFTREAVEAGINSALSYQLYLHRKSGDRFGALNLYGRELHAFDESASALGEVFAAHCATVLASAIAREGLQAALESRDVIGQAKGVLMVRHGAGATDAFERLRQASQARNVKLRELARQVVETGRLP